jgi:hypothetical protein
VVSAGVGTDSVIEMTGYAPFVLKVAGPPIVDEIEKYPGQKVKGAVRNYKLV